MAGVSTAGERRAAVERTAAALHEAALSDAASSVFRSILREAGDEVAAAALRVPDRDGSPLLHNLLYTAEASSVLVARVLELWPGAARAKDTDGTLPLHVAAANSSDAGRTHAADRAAASAASVEAMLCLVDAFPGAAAVRDPSTGRLPLLAALLADAPGGVITALLDAFPAACGAVGAWSGVSDVADSGTVGAGAGRPRLSGGAAEHAVHVVDRSDSGEVVGGDKAVVGSTSHDGRGFADPDSGFYPLHAAIESSKDPGIVARVLHAFPAAASLPARDGQLPLHLALRARPTDDDTMLALLKLHPAAVRAAMDGGITCLHRALMAHANDAVIVSILEAWPEATRVRGPGGTGLVLHTALSCQAGPTSLMAIIDEHPDACSVALDTATRSLPIHIAARLGTASEVASKLLRCFPAGARALDGDGRTPLVVARRNGKRAIAEALAPYSPE